VLAKARVLRAIATTNPCLTVLIIPSVFVEA
jgi:hypothetical protein